MINQKRLAIFPSTYLKGSCMVRKKATFELFENSGKIIYVKKSKRLIIKTYSSSFFMERKAKTDRTLSQGLNIISNTFNYFMIELAETMTTNGSHFRNMKQSNHLQLHLSPKKSHNSF